MSLLINMGLTLEYIALVLAMIRNKRIATMTIAAVILINVLLLFFLGEV
jgi:hypothetical protein